IVSKRKRQAIGGLNGCSFRREHRAEGGEPEREERARDHFAFASPCFAARFFWLAFGVTILGGASCSSAKVSGNIRFGVCSARAIRRIFSTMAGCLAATFVSSRGSVLRL